MKTIKFALTVSLLTVTPVIKTMAMMDATRPNIQAVIASTSMQSEANAIYKEIANTTGGKGDVSIQLPGDYTELLKNLFTFVHEISAEEMENIEQMHMAYCALDFPPFASSLIKQIMGSNTDFMSAFSTYEKTWSDYQKAMGTLMMDLQNTDSKANPTEDFKKFLTLKKSYQDQLTTLQKMFMADKANIALTTHMKKMEYLAEQHVRWGIAFAMAANPELVKDLSPETFERAKNAVKTLFTSSKINKFKNSITAAKQK